MKWALESCESAHARLSVAADGHLQEWGGWRWWLGWGRGDHGGMKSWDVWIARRAGERGRRRVHRATGGARRGRGAECEAVAPSACCAGAPGGGERRGKCSVCSGEWLQRGGGSWEAEHRPPRPHLSRPRAVAIRTAPAPSPRSSRERRVGRRPSHRSSPRPRSARCQGLGARWVPLREGESAGLLSGREDVGALRLAAPGCGANSNLDRLPRGGWGVKGRRGGEVVVRLQSQPANGACEHGGRG